MYKHILAAALLLQTSLITVADTTSLKPADVLAWPRMSAPAFGCQLEQRYAYKDKSFNCATRQLKRNWGDACHVTKFNYSGPQLPDALARTLHPAVENIQLEWEYGRLRSINITFNKTIKPRELATIFPGLKLDTPMQRSNLNDASLQECAKNKSCLLLEGFTHEGSADVDCGH